MVGVVAITKNPKSPINRTLAIFCLFLFLWSAGYFFPFTSDSESLTLLSFQLLHTGALFITVAHFHFVATVLGIQKEKRSTIVAGYLFNLAVLPFVYTDYFIPEVVPKGGLTYYPNLGPVYHIWLAVWFFFLLYSIYCLIKHLKLAKGIRKQQIKFMLIGNSLTFLFGSTNYLLAYDIPFPPYLNVLTPFYGIFLAYIILRYRFLDIRFTFYNSFKSILAFGISLGLSTLTLIYFLEPFLGFGVAHTIIFAVFLVIFHYTKGFFDSRRFYQFFYLTNVKHLIEGIQEFKERTTFYEDLDELNKDVKELFREFNIKAPKIIAFRQIDDSKYSKLRKYFQKNPNFLVTKEVEYQQLDGGPERSFYKELKGLGEVCFPLYQGKEKLIGILVLGKKPFDDLYTKDELEIIASAAYFIGLSLAIILYNEELQAEIKKKTRQLRSKNVELKKRYQTEKETAALLSHELKTPISIAYNAAQAFGFFIDRRKKGLGDYYEKLHALFLQLRQSIERMNMTSTSILRLNEVEGQMSIERLRLDLDYSIGPIIEVARQKAQAKGLKFKADIESSSKDSYAAVVQFEQIITILLDNAIKYTEEGFVDIKVFLSDGMIVSEVTDSGPGIPTELRKDIFKRFFRGQNHRHVEGLGIGLYMAKRILDALGGQIDIKTPQSGRGTLFHVELPVFDKATA